MNVIFGLIERDRRKIGLAGFALAAIHSVMSLALLSPGYFPKFFNGAGTMTLAGELSTLLGVLALAGLVWMAALPAAGPSDDRRLLRRLGLGVLALTALHVAVMGWAGWFKVADWPAGLPPITLISFVIAVLGLALGLLPRGRAE